MKQFRGQIVVHTAVKAVANSGNGNEEVCVAGDFYEALNAKVRTMINDARARARGNGRVTLKPSDL